MDLQFQFSVFDAGAFVELFGEGGLGVDGLVVGQRLVLGLLALPQRFPFGLQFFQFALEEDELVLLVLDLYDLVLSEGGADGLDFPLQPHHLLQLAVLL